MEKRKIGELTPEQKDSFLVELKSASFHIIKLGSGYVEITTEEEANAHRDRRGRISGEFSHPNIFGILAQTGKKRNSPFAVHIIGYELRSSNRPYERIEKLYNAIIGKQ